MKTVSDIMVGKVISVKKTDNVYQARMLFKDKGIRHLPVLDDKTGEFVGVLTQRSLLNHAFNIVEKFGLSGLKKREKRTPVEEIMTTDCDVAVPDMDLLTAAKLFMDKKHSCLPVVKEKQLQGIVTSVDFVKLALYLLKS
jgi:CBS domain-containing membrane protein